MPFESGLSASGVDAGYASRVVLRGASLDLRPGDSTAIVGPNGAGKTTLLKVLAGTLKPSHGSVTLDGRPLSTMTRRDIARKVAIVPQKLEIGFGLTGRDVVMLGRTPYLGFLGSETVEDRRAVDRATSETETSDFVNRPFSELSGGEAQRVVLAMALAQETPYLLLDEPTVHLDLGQQWKLIEKLMSLRHLRGVGILAIVHDLTLAGLGFDRVLLMADGKVVADGTPAEVLTVQNIRQGFGAPVRVWQDGSGVTVVLDPLAKQAVVV